jgi:poly-gamma-glutamate biosynthesis protein PgsC/CapC
LVLEAVGLGLVVSLLFSEFFGLAAGGMVVPGYVALEIDNPLRLAGTLAAALATFGLMRFMSGFIFLYGRRRLVLTILVGFLFGGLLRRFGMVRVAGLEFEMQAIGYIIPGLISTWMEKQGALPTLCSLVIAASLVRLLLIVISGGELVLVP